MNTVTATVLGYGRRRVVRLKGTDSCFYGYASINGKKTKVAKLKGKGNRAWSVA